MKKFIKSEMLNLFKSKLLTVGVAIGVFAFVFLAAANANAACQATGATIALPVNSGAYGGTIITSWTPSGGGDYSSCTYDLEYQREGDVNDWFAIGSTGVAITTYSWDTTLVTGAPASKGDHDDYRFRVRFGGLQLAATGNFALDNTAPVKNAITTVDADKDGHLDRIDVTFTEAVGMDTSRVSTSGFTVAGYTVETPGSWSGQTFRIPLTELGTGDTDAVPDVAYTNPGDVTGLQDLAGNNLTNFGATAATDAAAPAQVSAVFQDNNNDGQVDRVVMTMSENTTYTVNSGSAATNWTISTPGTINLTSIDTLNAGSGSETLTFLVTADAGKTGGTVPQINFLATGDDVMTGAGGAQSSNTETTILTDEAAPVPLTATYLDIDNNGTIDRADVTWSEVPTLALFEAADHAFVGTSAFGAITPTGAVVSGNDLQIDITPTNPNITGSLAALTYTYTEQGTAGGIRQGTNNSVTSAAKTVVDNAAPVPLSATYLDTIADGTIDRVYVTFSGETTNTLTDFEAGDHVFSSGSSFGAITPSAAVFAGNVLQITVTPANSNVTGSATAPTYTYTAQGATVGVNDGLGHNTITDVTPLDIVDDADPRLVSAGTLDVDGNGLIDGYKLTFSETIDETSLTDNNANGFAVAAFGTGGGLTEKLYEDAAMTDNVFDDVDQAIFYLGFTETVAGDYALGGTSIKPDLTYVDDNIDDLATVPNELASIAAFTEVDTAAPVLLSADAATKTTGNASGKTITMALKYSENVSANSSTTVGDYTVEVAGTATAIAIDSVNPVTDTITLNLNTSDINQTTAPLQVSYGADKVKDEAGATDNSAAAKTDQAITDDADPIALSAVYRDLDNNGKVDAVDITLSEDVAVTTAKIAAWTVPTAGTINLAKGAGAVDADITKLSAGILRWKDADAETNFNGNAGITGGATAPQISYTLGATGSSIHDTANNQLANIVTLNVTDNALPVVASAKTGDSATENGQIDKLTVVYTEAVNDADYNAVAVTGYTMLGTGTGSGAATLTYNFTEKVATPDTNATPALTWTEANAIDLLSNLFNDTGAPANATDDAGPAIISARSISTTQVEVTFSENILDASLDIGDITFGNFAVGATNGVDSAFASGAANDNKVTFTVPGGGAIGVAENTGTVKFTAATVISDAVPVFNTQTGTVQVADGIAMTISARDTKDLDHNGQIDAIKITFTEPIDDDTVLVANFALEAPYNGNDKTFTVANNCAGGVRTADSNYICLAFVEEGVVAGDTDITPTVLYTAGTLKDANGVSMATEGAPVDSTDTAAPVPMSATYLDTDDNGTIDRVDVAWSEAPTLDEFDVVDHVFSSGSALGAITPVSATTNGDDLRIVVTPANTGVTGSSVALTYTYNNLGTAGSVKQGTNESITSSAVTVADNAAPVPLSATYWDTTNDGTIDRVYVTFSSEITQSVGFEAGDHVFSAGSSFGAITPSAASFSGNVLQITISPANPNITGSGVAPTYTYTAQGAGGDVDDSLGHNAVTDLTPIDIVDKAAPVPVSGTYLDTGFDGTIDRADITFSSEIANTLTGYEILDHVFNSGSAFGAVAPTGAVFAGNVLQIGITPTNTGVTGSTAALTYAYTNATTPGSVNDGGLGNSAITDATPITLVDAAGPVVMKVFVSPGINKIKLQWSESVQDGAAANGSERLLNYTLQGGSAAATPTSATNPPATAPTGNNYVELQFGVQIFVGSNTLDVTSVKDLIGVTMNAQSGLVIQGGATVSGLHVPDAPVSTTITFTGLATAVSPATILTVRYCMDDINDLLLGCTDLNDTSTWTNLTASDGTFNAVSEMFGGSNISVATLANGAVTIHVAAQDSNSVFGIEDTITFTKSVITPVVVTTAPAAGAGVSGATVAITATTNGGANTAAFYQIDGGAWVAIATVWDTTVLANGTHSIRVKDTVAAVTGYSDTLNAVVNNGNVPALLVTTPAAGASLANTATVNAVFTNTGDTGTGFYSINGGAWTAVTSDTTANSVAVVVGANTLQVKSSKTVGSSVTWGYSPINTFTVAAIGTPVVVTTAPAAGAGVSGATVAITATTNGGANTAAFYQIDGGAWVAIATVWDTTVLANGTHSIRVKDTVAAVTGYSDTLNAVVNNGNVPALLVTTPAAGASLANTATVNAVFTNTGDTGTGFYSINGGAWTAVTSDTTANSVAVVVGANTLQVKSSKTVGSSVTWGYSPINTFTVAAAVTPPSVFAQYPLDNAADVAIDVYPTVTFDEDMDVSTINSTNIQMRDYTTDAPISIFVTQSTTSIRTFIINPDIVYGGHYYFYITGAKDLAGNTMTAYTTKALQEFTYVGYVATPPTIESFLPGNNETIGVVIGPGQDAISLTFDKLMYEQSLTTNNIKLYKDDGTEVTLSSVMIQNGANKTIVQLLPAANLEYGASYYITVNGNVQDYDDGDALVSTWTVGNKTSHHFHTIAQPTGALSVDNIRQVRFWGIPAGGYANGWEWVMYATIPTDANHFHLKFADWNSGGNTLPVFSNATSNMKYWSEQITAGLIGSESNPVLITAASTYPADIVLNTDDNTSTDSPGMQTNIHIQVQIPSGQASGSYSTSYGLEN